MSRKTTSTLGIEEALIRLTGVVPKAQGIANGIMSLGNTTTLNGGREQLKSAIRAESFPLTEEILRRILIDTCGLEPEEARRRTRLVFKETT